MSLLVKASAASIMAAAVVFLLPSSALAAEEFSVTATVETDPVSHSGDAADDPAIWVHPTDPAKSVVIGTDKDGALEVYNLSGTRIQRIDGDYGNNVDLRGDIVVSADDEADVMHVYRISPRDSKLTLLEDVPTEVTPHGICMYKSPTSGKLYAYPNSTSGRLEQIELTISGDDVTASSVRLFDAGSAVEGCYADQTTGKLYLGEEDEGVWVYGAEPDAGDTRTQLDNTGKYGHLVADVEGITAAHGYLIVSSQGSNDFAVYNRTSGTFLGYFTVATKSGDDCNDTDGIDATAAYLGSKFPHGLFVCQDGDNYGGNQNFKFVPINKITAKLPAGTRVP